MDRLRLGCCSHCHSSDWRRSACNSGARSSKPCVHCSRRPACWRHDPCRPHSESCYAPGQENILDETIAWAAPCVSGRGRRIPANLFGALVATNEDPHKMIFVARKSGRPFARTINLEGSVVTHEPKFLCENLVIFPAAGKG